MIAEGQFKAVHVPAGVGQDRREVLRLYQKAQGDVTRTKNRIKGKYREHGVSVAGKRVYGDLIIEKRDPRGRKYYWIGGDHLNSEDVPGSDLEAIEEGFISVTPIHLDLTNYSALRALRKWTW